MKNILVALFLLVTFVGCSKPTDDSGDISVIKPPSKAHAIEWFDGSVDEAFSKAKSENKPVFLYWGAVWCPPCNQLKATLFKRRDFIEKTQLFVMVYLDGDTDRAQRYGAEFSVMGYPTLIMFDPEGTEVTRIPGGLQLERYEKVLDLVLKETRPVKEIVETIANGQSSRLVDDDFRLLAFYSWGQDNQKVLPKESSTQLLGALYAACPSSLPDEKSRLFMQYLNAKLGDYRKDTKQQLIDDREFVEKAQEALKIILLNADLALSNVYALRYEKGYTIEGLTVTNSEERQVLMQNWQVALDRIAATESLSPMERLGALYAEVSFSKLSNNGKISQMLEAKIQSKVTMARNAIGNADEQSTVINMVRNILVHADMLGYADQVISEEVNKAKSPYYFMLELADFAKREGRYDEAIVWLKKAYGESKAGATRFQWGVNYFSGLLEMEPENESGIEALGLELIQSLGGDEGAFYNRNARRLNRMDKELVVWNKDGAHQGVVGSLRKAMQIHCVGLPNGSDARMQCDKFLVVQQ